MFDEIEKELMMKFLTRSYPVSRIKHKMRFKRGVRLDNGQVHLIKNKADVVALELKLTKILEKVFYSKPALITAVLKTFLHLETYS